MIITLAFNILKFLIFVLQLDQLSDRLAHEQKMRDDADKTNRQQLKGLFKFFTSECSLNSLKLLRSSSLLLLILYLSFQDNVINCSVGIVCYLSKWRF